MKKNLSLQRYFKPVGNSAGLFFNFFLKMLILSIFVILLGLIPALIFFMNRQNSLELRTVKPFIYLVAFSSVYEFVFSFLLKINVTIWFRIYSLIELIVLMVFFFKITHGRYKILQFFYFVVYLLFFISVSIFGNKENFDKADSYLSMLEFLFVINFSIIWFKGLFTDLTIESLWDSPIFCFLAGLILYFSGTTFLFLLSEVISKEYQKSFYEFWILNIVLAFVFRLILIITVWRGLVK